MTCIVGLVHKGRIYMGGDSAAVSGWTRRVTQNKKVFRNGPFLIGYTTSFRMGQLIEHELSVPAQADGQSDIAYMVTTFVEATRTLFKKKGFTKVESNSEKGGQFLVGYRGNLYSIQSDFQVGHSADGFDAVGSGSDFALGALASTAKMAPTRRVKHALDVSAHFNMGVCAPFYVRSMSG